MSFITLVPARGAKPARTPWRSKGDGTIIARGGKVVCVLGHPDEALSEDDITNGAVITAAPHMLALLARALPELEQEADQRETGGVGEYSAAMRSLANETADVLRLARGLP